jgi:hypothetical protein
MKRKYLSPITLVFIMAVVLVTPVWAKGGAKADLSQVRRSTAKYHNLRTARVAGYGLVTGLDYCFDNPGVGGMGYHYISTNLLDTIVDPSRPEALVYAPINGKLKLVAVEYIVPIDKWDAENSTPPELFGRTFETNQTLGVYALHAWIWENNSLGIFSDWNPRVSCN